MNKEDDAHRLAKKKLFLEVKLMKLVLEIFVCFERLLFSLLII